MPVSGAENPQRPGADFPVPIGPGAGPGVRIYPIGFSVVFALTPPPGQSIRWTGEDGRHGGCVNIAIGLVRNCTPIALFIVPSVPANPFAGASRPSRRARPGELAG
jgi:hypothetical protein